MVKVKVKQIRNSDFNSGMQMIINSRLPIQVALRVSKIADIILDEQTRVNKIWDDLVLEYAEKDEKGEPTGKIKADKVEEAQGKITEFENAEVELVFDPLKVEDLGALTLTPIQMRALSFVFV